MSITFVWQKQVFVQHPSVVLIGISVALESSDGMLFGCQITYAPPPEWESTFEKISVRRSGGRGNNVAAAGKGPQAGKSASWGLQLVAFSELK